MLLKYKSSLILLVVALAHQFLLASCASTYGYNPESQSPSHQAIISKMMAEDRKVPQHVRDRTDPFWTWVGSLFYCLMLGICDEAPNVQCGVQGVQSRTYTKDYPANMSEQERVTGGSYASEAEFPWSVALRLDRTFCGGSIIHESWIMTAAHCVWGRLKIAQQSNHYGLAGCNQRSSSDCTKLYFTWVWNHPLYFPPLQFVPGIGIQNDVALIKIANPFSTWPSNIRPVCMPSKMSPPWGFDKVTVAGWGIDEWSNLQDDLKYATLTTVPYGVCSAYFVNVQVTYICASPDGYVRPNGGSACNGDSGSAVVRLRDGFWQADGIVSYGGVLGCLNFELAFNGFTHVWLFKNWINFIILNWT